MDHPKIIVIGSSAGGLKALTTIVGGLPAELNAAFFIVQHLPPEHHSFLPQILSDTGALPALHPVDREPIRQGRIYVAPPDHHMLLNHGHVRVVHGPRENRQRPAIDTLFRSAARAYGAQVIGVVLSGLLDDGTIGLQAIKQRGGLSVVQSPSDAEYPSMPTSALRYARIDYELPLAGIPALLVQLINTPVEDESDLPAALAIEADIAEQELDSTRLLASAEALGQRSVYTCPTCNGSLWEIGVGEPLRFRCHVGHAFTAASLMTEQTRSLEGALWSAVRLMEEKSDFLRRMAERRKQANLAEAARPFEEHAGRLAGEIDLLRRLVLDGVATRQPDENPAPDPGLATGGGARPA